MKIAVIGMSHIGALQKAYAAKGSSLADGTQFVFVPLRRPGFGMKNGRFSPEDLAPQHQSRLSKDIANATSGAHLAVLCIRGSIFHLSGLVPGPQEHPASPDAPVPDPIRKKFVTDIAINNRWLSFISLFAKTRIAVIPPPPPIESESWIRAHSGVFEERIKRRGLNPPLYRLGLWQLYAQMTSKQANDHHFEFIDLPRAVFSNAGFLREACASFEPTHGNEEYGEVILRHVIEFAAGRDFISGAPSGSKPGAGTVAGNQDGAAVTTAPDARRHPYAGLPDRAYWKQGVAQVAADQFDPVEEMPFRISRTDKVATAGSCFAQHISKRIRSIGFQFLVTEHPAGDGPDDGQARGFYDFSARFGNIYTARQLVQLFDRAYGYFSPVDSHWSLPGNRFCDPFRPRIEPDGFPSIEALVEDRRRHFAAVRELFEQLDIFVFTLGLTECWLSRLDGAAYPVAPGVAGGVFDPAKHEFANFGVSEVVADLQSFIRKLRLVNPGAKVLLTVSPVPLVATYEPKHVLVSTTYSKSVLRVAADMVSRSCEGVCYFPSFEIITGHYNRGRYFGPDLRSVTEEGVDHVMAVFMRHMTDAGESAGARDARAATPESDDDQEMAALAEAACDEELLERK